MIRITSFDIRTEKNQTTSLDELAAVLADPNQIVWLDFENEPVDSAEPILLNTFKFHHLAVDDALEETHVPKIDDWGDYLYIVLNAITIEHNDSISLHTHELDIFLGKNYLVTHHDDSMPFIEKTWTTLARDTRPYKYGPDRLLYKLIDDMVSEYMNQVDLLDDEMDLIEDEVLTKAKPDTLERIFAIKRMVLSMRRIFGPQREVLNKLARDDYEVIDPAERIFFRDIYDHLVRIHDLNENMRDLISGALETYLSVINNRMNEVMKTLTIITTLFMPLTFLTGFFGMNFFEPAGHLGVWTDTAAFSFTLAVVLITPIAMFLYMRKRSWL
jgi:magnesium transporter